MENSKNLHNQTPIFWNYALDKGKLKSFVSWFLKTQGEKKTLELLEELKILGFGYATEAGISLGIEDLKIPPKKSEMLAQAQALVSKSRFLYKKGKLTDIERTQGFMEVWNEVNESLKDEVVSYFQKTDILNPVYMMAFSGARGNLSQVRQLVGMRGLMSDPQGKIIDFPILSNFREGLTLTEYLISTYGARKGIVDTALRTATAGYLTRRLVDVAQHVVVSKFDCGTQRGIFLFDMKDGIKTIYNLQNRVLGRVLAQDLYQKNELGKEILIASKNQEIDSQLAAVISKITKKVLVRSPLTCENIKRVCQLCYGWSLATSRLVSIGEAVGVIAGQSIGEPGTQLTMRTFHTGGVFAGSISAQINAPFNCKVEYTGSMAGSLLRVSLAKNSSKILAFLTKASGTMILKPLDSPTSEESSEKESQTYHLPAFTLLFARNGEWVQNNAVLAQIASVTPGQKATQISEQTVYASFEGEVLYSHLDLIEEIDEKYGERVSKSENWAKVWVLSAKIFQTPIQTMSKNMEQTQTDSSNDYFPQVNDWISKKTIVQEIEWQSSYGSVLVGMNQNSNQPTQFKSQTLNSAYSFSPKLQRLSHFTVKNSIQNLFFENRETHKFKKNSGSNELRIFANYKVSKKFLKNSTFSRRQTFLTYPLETKKMFQVSRWIKNAQVFLPMSEPGVLKTWLNSQSFKPMKKRKNELQSLANQFSGMKLKPKFSRESQTNYAQPLILNNFMPFRLNIKSFEIYKEKTKKTNSSIFSPEFVYNYQFDKVLKNVFLSKPEKLPQTKFNATSRIEKRRKSENSEFLNKFRLISGMNSFHENKESPGFQDVFFKQPLLTLPSIKHGFAKMGYQASIEIFKDDEDIFLSFLPLDKKTVSLSNPSLVKNSQLNLPTPYQLERSNLSLHPSLPYSPLRNTNQWQPKSHKGLIWYSSQTKLPTSFICVSQNPSFYFSFFSQMLTYHIKHPRQLKVWKNKAVRILNLAQSQVRKKSRKRIKVKSSDSSLTKNLFNISIRKKRKIDHTELEAKKNSSIKFTTMNTVTLAKIQSEKKSQMNFRTFSISNYAYYQKFKRKMLQDRFQKKTKKETFSTSLKKTSVDKKKLKVRNRKEQTQKKVKYLKTFLTQQQKPNIRFSEVFSIAQFNYVFESFTQTSKFKNQLNKKFWYSEFLKKQELSHENLKTTISPPEMVLTNPQGLRKELKFSGEGVLSFSKFKTKKTKQQAKKTMYPEFLIQPRSSKYLNSFLKINDFTEVQENEAKNVESLKLKFLNYLHKRTQNLSKAKQPQIFETLNSSNTNLQLMFSKAEKKCFTVLPFLIDKNEKMNQTKFQETEFAYPMNLDQTAMTKISQFPTPKLSKTELYFKPGWIYFSSKTHSSFMKRRKSQNIGKHCVDDIHIESQKIVVERIKISKDSKKEGVTSIPEKLFTPSKWVQNKKCRFFKVTPDKISSKPMKISYLLRPVYSTQVLSTEEMKTNLYEKMKRDESKQYAVSHKLYQTYFSEILNPQKMKKQFVSKFPKLDLHIAPEPVFRKPNLNNWLMFFKKTKNKMFNSKKQKLKKGKISPKLKKISRKKFKSNNYKKNLSLFYKRIHFPTYFSNQSLNVMPFSVLSKLYNSNVDSYSFPDVNFNTQKNILFTQRTKTKLEKAYLQQFFQVMIDQRSQHNLDQNFSIQTKQNKVTRQNLKPFDSNFKRHLSPKAIKTLISMQHSLYSTPKFSFGLNMHYSFFLNPRLRTMGSWKQTFEDLLRSNVLSKTKTEKENFRVQRFFKKREKTNFLAYHYISPLTNLLIQRSGLVSKDNIVGLTRFYSPYEGIVLKDYAFEENTGNLEKTWNTQLDPSVLEHRKGQKLILTKDDLFSLNWPMMPQNFSKKQRDSASSKVLSSPSVFKNFEAKQAFFNDSRRQHYLNEQDKLYTELKNAQKKDLENLEYENYTVSNFRTNYENKIYNLRQIEFQFPSSQPAFKMGQLLHAGDRMYGNYCLPRAGQLIHLNLQKATFRKAEYFSLSPKTILHAYNGHTIEANKPVMTLAFETLNSGDIVQGIPKVEQYLEARTTIQGRLFLNSLPILLYAIYRRYLTTLEMEKAARQSFLKIQQILVDGVQRVYRSQGVGITDKHVEIIVRQMTSKVKIIYGGQTGFFPGELVDLELVERVNRSLMVKVVYEPVVLGITRASLEVDSFLSAASFQQTTKVLTKAALENKRDFLKGLKENLLVGNLLPAGTGYIVPISASF